MTGKASVPDIEDYLVRRGNGPCLYIRNSTPQQRAIIEKHLVTRKWVAMARWLQDSGSDVSSYSLKQHFDRRHEPDA